MSDQSLLSVRESISVRAPASLSNLGPGFDTLGVAVTGMSDTVHVSRTSAGVSVSVHGDNSIPANADQNTASVAAMEVCRRAGYAGGIEVSIDKGIPFGSGLGGSAASAVAGAAATNLLLGAPLDRGALVSCALAGEAVASKSLHGDNVIPALVGGVVVVDARSPQHFRQIAVGKQLFLAIIMPHLQIQTAAARRDLPEQVDFRAAVNNASALALLVDALSAGDINAVGSLIMRDELVEPIRARNIPCFEDVRQAAIVAGSPGCAISGSGPTMFAVAATDDLARSAVRQMASACEASGLTCSAMVSHIDVEGAQMVSRVSER